MCAGLIFVIEAEFIELCRRSSGEQLPKIMLGALPVFPT